MKLPFLISANGLTFFTRRFSDKNILLLEKKYNIGVLVLYCLIYIHICNKLHNLCITSTRQYFHLLKYFIFFLDYHSEVAWHYQITFLVHRKKKSSSIKLVPLDPFILFKKLWRNMLVFSDVILWKLKTN